MNTNLSTSLLPKRALFATTAIAAGLAVASSALTATPAQAFGVTIAPQYGSTENTGATASLDFSFADTLKGVMMTLDIKNTTNGSAGLGATSATLVGVAFDLLSGASVSKYDAGSSNFTKTYTDVSIPGLANNASFSYGIRSDGSGNFVGGKPTAGLTALQSTSVSFLLSGVTGNAATVETSFFNGFKDGSLQAAGRFQQVNAGGGSDKVMAGEAVPEPTTIGGMLLSGMMLAKFRNRKNAKKA